MACSLESPSRTAGRPGHWLGTRLAL